MYDSARFFLFLTAAVLLAVAPGPGMLYVLARSLAGGKREGVLSALGTFRAAWCM
jgi:threonine/homoserine/homoserine lactone efflux protein